MHLRKEIIAKSNATILELIKDVMKTAAAE